MKSYRGSWFPLGILIILTAGLAISGCATTSFGDAVAALPSDEKAAAEAAIAFNKNFVKAQDFEEMDHLSTTDLVVKSSYLGGMFTNKRTYWETLKTKRGVAKYILYSWTIRDLRVQLFGDTAEVSWILEVYKTGGGDRQWQGEVHYLFKLRREGGDWKVYYFQQ